MAEMLGRAVAGAVFLCLLIGIAMAADGCQRTFAPEQYAAARAREHVDALAAEAKAQKVKAAEQAHQEADAELLAASAALYNIRATSPSSPEGAELLAQLEDRAVQRWEAAQFAVYGPDWRQYQAALEADAAYTTARRLNLPR